MARALSRYGLASQGHRQSGKRHGQDTRPRNLAPCARVGPAYEALYLAPDATEEEALDAPEARITDKGAAPDPKKHMPVEAVAEMMRGRHLERATMAVPGQPLATSKVGLISMSGEKSV